VPDRAESAEGLKLGTKDFLLGEGVAVSTVAISFDESIESDVRGARAMYGPRLLAVTKFERMDCVTKLERNDVALD
jgi:hypothetical protein